MTLKTYHAIITQCIVVGILSGCGGGSKDDAVKAEFRCEAKTVASMHISKNMKCLHQGDAVIDQFTLDVIKENSTSTEVINWAPPIEETLTQFGDNVLTDKNKYNKVTAYKRFICFTNLNKTGVRNFGQMANQLLLGDFKNYYTEIVGTKLTGVNIYFQQASGEADNNCDPTKYPIVINASTGVVESISPSLLR
ncbi:hypothetical protein [Diaphorobacter sp. J5-51]|uniref:hypothetical protein n=1 Tax=Diaphorobacter sp. J5-51 TaxID=680496 RepID=UPI0012F7A127|nr:hypothetical protein [Diaphorobacter sp. J5-51]